MRMEAPQSVLLVIDLQSRLLPAIEDHPAVLANANWLVDVAQAMGVPCLATEHCPGRIGHTEPGLGQRFRPEEVIEKSHFSAVSEGGLLQSPAANRQQWIVAGAETHVCVLQTVLDLLALGRHVFVVDEAVGSRRARDKELALQRMAQKGAAIVCREMVAFEWLERAETPLFRDILQRFIR